ncbi:MAG TPA: VOC family protein [Thermomicrobiales bacterium]|jgi:predicted enzyme related to lactoylglutathione lyase|nr:VOC family protein [Thermomicrobiales bacterium]
MLRGFALIRYRAEDLDAAKAWYTQLLGFEPYFEVPGQYIEFRLGDHSQELGIMRAENPNPGGVVSYWHVDDIEATYARLLEMGATENEPPYDFGNGFVASSVIDPFGNLFGVMYNPHYVETLQSSGISSGEH